MALYSTRFSWVRSPTAWQQTQAWQQRQSAIRQDFEAVTAGAASAFTVAMSTQIKGNATIASKRAKLRLIDEAQAALAKAKIDKLA